MKKYNLSWKWQIVILLVMSVIIFMALLWGTASRQWHAGKPDYDKLVEKDNAGTLYEGE